MNKKPNFFASQSSISRIKFCPATKRFFYHFWPWECKFGDWEGLYIKNCCLTFRKTEKIHEMTTIFTQKRLTVLLRTILIENSGHFVNLLLRFRKGQDFIEKISLNKGSWTRQKNRFVDEFILINGMDPV